MSICHATDARDSEKLGWRSRGVVYKGSENDTGMVNDSSKGFPRGARCMYVQCETSVSTEMRDQDTGTAYTLASEAILTELYTK